MIETDLDVLFSNITCTIEFDVVLHFILSTINLLVKSVLHSMFTFGILLVHSCMLYHVNVKGYHDGLPCRD